VYRHLPDFRTERSDRLDVVGLILFGAGIALLSYVLEIFGEHTLSGLQMLGPLAIAFGLLGAYGWHASRTPFPLLRLDLFGTRTFRTSVLGGFVTRLGVGGMPLLLPLLYQLGLGLPAWQSGLLMMPTAIAAMGMKFISSRLLQRFGDKWTYSLAVNDLYYDFMGPSLASAGKSGTDARRITAYLTPSVLNSACEF